MVKELGNIFQNGVDTSAVSQIMQYKTAILRVGFEEGNRDHGYINLTRCCQMEICHPQEIKMMIVGISPSSSFHRILQMIRFASAAGSDARSQRRQGDDR